MSETIDQARFDDRDAAWWDRAALADAMKHMAKLDPPAVTARYLPENMVAALVAAKQGPNGYRLPHNTPPPLEREMRLAGLVGFDGPFLGAYATKVRRVIMDGRD